MSKTPIITVTLPTGEVIQRATWRTYTHAVVLTDGSNRPHALAWCGSHALAAKQLAYWTADGGKRLRWRVQLADSWEVTILPIDARTE